MTDSNQIRNAFKDFFRSKEHHIVPSAPMVVKGDPTLMFTNAGMNQFKDIILGNSPIRYSRVADSQKCLRVSGKHNDLEEVGLDTYHHTMFEMLGNWSFGDYFKKEAIAWAWEFLTEVAGLDKDRLYVTVFEGSPAEHLDRDNEAAEYWAQFVPKNRIINGNKKDNFWEMGDTGPCGPCSEIHYDIRSIEERKAIDGAQLVNNHPGVIEIWNLVFMQYNRKADKSLEPLPAKVIDTGMGFERLCMAVQGKTSNYDTDIFQTLIAAIARLAGTEYGKDPKQDIAMRVVADHIRTIAFSIADGQLPSNAKAGYVIRRILRRAVRYGYTFLHQSRPFLYQLLPTLVEQMGDAYPELRSQQNLIERVTKEEEEAFLRTLETGIKLLSQIIVDMQSNNRTELPGATAFTLYDTYGFPLDLTQLILREAGMTLDEKEFDTEMQKQKQRARNAAAVETGDWTVIDSGESSFVGYDTLECDCHILRYRKMMQKNRELYQIVLDQTPFYAEMGGQTGDCGTLVSDQETLEITDTKRENNLTVHIAQKLPLDPHADFKACVNGQKRTAAECNHTATHLLHHALRQVLGDHVEQKGSYVSPDVLRFDFSHYQKLSPEELRRVEQLVTADIRRDYPLCEQRNLPIEQAKEMGAVALFGEKYGDKVRVVQFGESIELCGGTHISSTGRIGSFRIVSESSIAAGIRRIEAVSAENCEKYLYLFQDALLEIKSMLNNAPSVVDAFHKLLAENEDLRKSVETFRKEKIQQIKEYIVANRKELNGNAYFHTKAAIPADVAKDIAFAIRSMFPQKSIFLAASDFDGKASLSLMLSDDLVAAGLNASALVRQAARHIQGGGGGQPHFATAGGKNSDGLPLAVEEIEAGLG